MTHTPFAVSYTHLDVYKRQLLGSDAGLVGLLLDLLAVLVGTGEEHDVLALQSVIPGQSVGGHGAVDVYKRQPSFLSGGSCRRSRYA